MIIIIQFRHSREDKSISNSTNHVDASILSQIPPSFSKLHLKHSQSVSHRSFPLPAFPAIQSCSPSHASRKPLFLAAKSVFWPFTEPQSS